MGVFYGLRSCLIVYLVIGAILLLAVKAFSTPFLVCDPQAGVEGYEIENLDFVSGQSIPAEADGSIRLDMAPLALDGSYNIEIRAVNLWGRSDPTPFSFTKVPSPSAIGNPRLVP